MLNAKGKMEEPRDALCGRVRAVRTTQIREMTDFDDCRTPREWAVACFYEPDGFVEGTRGVVVTEHPDDDLVES